MFYFQPKLPFYPFSEKLNFFRVLHVATAKSLLLKMLLGQVVHALGVVSAHPGPIVRVVVRAIAGSWRQPLALLSRT